MWCDIALLFKYGSRLTPPGPGSLACWPSSLVADGLDSDKLGTQC